MKTLFEAWKRDRRLNPYPTWKAELDAIRAGKKALSLFDDDDTDEIAPLARGLEVVRHDRHLFVAHPSQLWRVPACVALFDTAFEDGTWSNAAEAQLSLLLGYTRAQRKAWLSHQRTHQAGWGAPTVYTLLTTAQRRVVVAMGKKCFGDLEVRMFSPQGRALRADAFTRIPEGLTLARVAVRPSRNLNDSLASPIQFLTRAGWR